MNHVAARPPRSSISVCSGVGGLDLGLSRACGVEPVVYIEREAFASAVLVARMEEAKLANAPVWDDVCTFDARPWRGLVDLVAGGTPCQDLSLAGKRAGLDGSRSRLFFEHVRIAVECEAPFFFWENVAGATRAVPRVCEHLAENGYRNGAWTIVRASDVGANHERARIFLLAYSDRFMSHGPRGRQGGWSEPPDARSALAHGHGRESERRSGLQHGQREALRHDADGRSSAPAEVAHAEYWRKPERTWEARREVGEWAPERCGFGGGGASVAHAERQGLALGPRVGGDARQEQPSAERGGLPRFPPGPDDRDAWSRILAIRPDLAPAIPAQPRLRRVADGLAGGVDASLRADRLRACGNGVHPEQAAHAWRGLWQHLFPMKEPRR